ncbi:MAG: AI-2E family transporter [Chloroflexi bacterium]|nr:AI-2E family transporter [Chloroflexota bacterium]MCI0577881.1 AI-2E family transporter [Chloroflexota bacterium]MCI0644483.1 AI-2E family transporter [Chloroflexota bacterium]MCI0730249.1 AI-2E family transporter [Chloroflexota bacterium]
MTDEARVAENLPPPVAEATTSTSPAWPASTKRLVMTVLLILFLLTLYRIRGLLIPVIMALVMAYVVLPIVDFLQQRFRLSRGLAIALIYLFIIAGIVAIPVGAIPQLITQGNNLVNNTPRYLQQLGEFLERPLVIGSYTIPLNELPLEEAYGAIRDNLISIIQTLGRQGFSLFGNLASATLSTVGWLIIILVLSFYMVKDYRKLWGSIVAIAPTSYHADVSRLGREISLTWNAFLRGQLILGFIVGLITFIAALTIGLPNALILALIAGLLEFVPNIGPALAAIPAILLALFQSDASWLGSQIGPLWFALVVLGVYIVIQQVENLVLVPRIIGRSLNLHPLVVLIGALAGASIAGILGILLAAPLLASARLILLYIYRKLLDQPPFPDLVEALVEELEETVD